MRTVEDLRAALVSLESAAPSTEELLAKHLANARPTVRRSHRNRAWPTVITGFALAAAIVIGVVAVLHGSADDRTVTGHLAADSPGIALPFRLTGNHTQLTLLNAHSDTASGNASGTITVAEYGSEVVIDVRTVSGRSTHSASASKVAVNGVDGWVDASCGLRDATSSHASAGTSTSNPSASEVNPTCSLSFDDGPWRVAIYVAGPGGGYRKITAQQFLQIGNHLQLADSPHDSSTWFSSSTVLAK